MKKSREKIYSVAAILLIIDQVIKLVVKSNLSLLQEIEVIPNFFSIYYIENAGAAFSILNGSRLFLILISFLILYMLDKYVRHEKIKDKLLIVSYGMIFSGIFGNLIDRILYGKVIDYLSFTIFNYDFAIFNFADICIVVGIFMLFILEFIDWRKRK